MAVDRPPVPRVSLRVEEACAALGVSWETWAAHVAPHVRVVRLGRVKLVAVTELQRFVEDRGESVQEALDGGVARRDTAVPSPQAASGGASRGRGPIAGHPTRRRRTA